VSRLLAIRCLLAISMCLHHCLLLQSLALCLRLLTDVSCRQIS
jgi:hypothetical protein